MAVVVGNCFAFQPHHRALFISTGTTSIPTISQQGTSGKSWLLTSTRLAAVPPERPPPPPPPPIPQREARPVQWGILGAGAISSDFAKAVYATPGAQVSYW